MAAEKSNTLDKCYQDAARMAAEGGHGARALPTLSSCASARDLRRRGGVALTLHDDLVERAEIGLGGGHQRVGIGGARGHGAAFMAEAHRDFGLRVGAFGHRVDLIEL